MQKVIFLKNYEGYQVGSSVYIDNNKAHSLIDKGIAKLFQDYEDKMMRSKRRTKWRL